LETQHYLNIKAATPYLNRIPYSIFMIGRQYIYPERLTIYHEGRIIGNVEYTIMIISSLVLVALCIYLFKKNKTYLALILLIFATTLPSFSPVAIAWLVAERYLYFGTLFYCILLTKILIDIENKTKLRNAVKVFATIIFIIYFARTFVRADNFSTSKKLWLNTMIAAPLSYRVYNNLGDVYANEGQYDLAIQNFTRSLELKPDYADAVHNLGFTYMQKGDVNKARYYLQKSFEMNPRLYQSLFKLGYIELQLGNLQGAKYYFQKTLELNPGNAEAIQLLNNILQAEKTMVIPASSPASQ
jgi:tetratricopeptide (TPR) repeat protein